MSHPFLYLVCALAAGILLQSAAPLPPEVHTGGAGIFLLAAWFSCLIRRNSIPAFIFILISTFFCGAALHAQAENNFIENRLYRLKSNEYTDFTGRLQKSPAFGIDHDYLYMNVTQVRFSGKNYPLRGRMRVTIPRTDHSLRLKNLRAGDLLSISARLNNSRGFKNFKQTGRDFFLKQDHIHKQAYCKSPLLVHKVSSSWLFSPKRFISSLRLKIQEAIEQHFPGPQSGLSESGAVLEALLLGARERVQENTRLALQHSGLYHLLAISGAHIALLSYMFFILLKFIKVPERTSFLTVITVLIFYAFLVEGRPSVIRATAVMVFFLTGKLIWKDTPVLNTLSLCAFILLIFHPFDLFSLGFQLTFAATFAIVLLYPALVKRLPLLPGKFSEVLAVSLAALAGVLPFIATAFNRVSFASLILNYPALIFVTGIMAGGYLFLITAGALPFIAPSTASVLDFLIRKFISLADFSRTVPFWSFRIPDPYPWALTGYIGCLTAAAAVKFRRGKIGFSAGALFFAVFLIVHPFSPDNPDLRVTFIDVGQGDAVLVEFPEDGIMLIDGGGFAASRFDVGERVVSRVLWAKGITRIDYLVCTHPHPDHFYGLFSISRNFRISEFWGCVPPENHPLYRTFIDQLSRNTIIRRVFRGDAFTRNGVSLRILHPPPDYGDSILNNHSMVIRLSYGDHAFLFSGDIEKSAEQIILKQFPVIKSQVLKVPHHGSSSSSTSLFLEAVFPEIAVITCGEYNRYGLPQKSVLQRYRESGTRIFRTDIHGAVEITSDGSRLAVRTVNGVGPLKMGSDH